MKSIVIRPITDLRYKISEIEKMCLNENKPVFITKNGSNHLVVMSQDFFEEKMELLALYQGLAQSEAESAEGKSSDYRSFMAGLKERVKTDVQYTNYAESPVRYRRISKVEKRKHNKEVGGFSR